MGRGAFELPGFTHYWGLSPRGNWVVMRKMAPSRFTRALRTITRWRRFNRHHAITEQHQTLSQKLRGHFAYYGITSKADALWRFRWEVTRAWHKWLSRRPRAASLPWPRLPQRLEGYPLPRTVMVHSMFRCAVNP